MQKRLIKLIIGAGICSAFFLATNIQAATNKTLLKIDKATIVKGYTIKHDQENLKFAVTPNQVDQEVSVELKTRSAKEIKLPEDKKLASKLYSFDMLGREYNPIITAGPSWIGIKHNSKSEAQKSIHYWDNNRNYWVELPSSPDSENIYIRAITHLPYSIVAVFEDSVAKESIEGQASWFYAPSMTAAMNVYNMGDKVKVTNIDNGKNVIVTIDDRGPFVLGRVIDLSSDSFALIAPLSQGVANVKVEKL